MPVWVEAGLLKFPTIYLNGGRRGFLVGLAPRALLEGLGAKTVEVALRDE